MKITWSWLKDFVTLECSAVQCGQYLTQSGTETHLAPVYAWAKHLRVVRIMSIVPHPNADSLRLCTVTDGAQMLTVVCGASNAREGLNVVLIRPGEYLPGSEKSLMPAVIRGVESAGMLCSPEELNLEGVFLNTPLEGILELSGEVEPGLTFDALLPEDWVLDCEVTSNRGDLMSVFGIARELVALGAASWRDNIWPSPLSVIEVRTTDAPSLMVKTPLCRQFHMATVHQNALYRAPSYVKRRLREVGMSLVHDVVDALNYYSHSFGTPFHVFDGACLEGGVTLEELSEPTVFEGLSQNSSSTQITLPAKALVLKDQRGIVALSGMLGAERGKCSASSQKLYVEAAEFDPKSISIAGQKTRLVTPSRMRFERGIDGSTVRDHLIQALTWMGYPVVDVHTVRPYTPPHTQEITLSLKYFIRFTGCSSVSTAEMRRRLERLGCVVRAEQVAEDEVLYVKAPSWRSDIRVPQDLIEEILRVKGWYTEVPYIRPLVTVSEPLTREQSRTQKAREYLIHQGLGEAVTWSFISASKARAFSLLSEESLKEMTLINPISKEMSVMRPSILPNLVDLALWHYSKALSFQGRFECGPVFFGGNPKEQKHVISAVLPAILPEAWGRSNQISFFDLKHLVEATCAVWGVSPTRYSELSVPWMHPGQCAQIWIGDAPVGFLGKIYPTLTPEHPLLCFEIAPDQCGDVFIPSMHLSLVQPIEKDLSFFLNHCPIGVFLEGIKHQDVDLVDVCLVDRFEKDGRTSIMVRCTFQPQEQSWSSEEIQLRLEGLVRWAHKQGMELRGNTLFSHV